MDWQELLEKDDRTSPEEYPNMCLITKEEFDAAVEAMRLKTIEECEQIVRDCIIPGRNWVTEQLLTKIAVAIAAMKDKRNINA
jgi:hypothetical protein